MFHIAIIFITGQSRINPGHTKSVVTLGISLILKVFSTVMTSHSLLIEMRVSDVAPTVATIIKYFPTRLTPEPFHRRVDLVVHKLL